MSIKLLPIVISLAFLSALWGSSHAESPIAGLFSGSEPVQYYVKTEDGWSLSLYRYKPKSFDKHTEPVILCHGFNFNSYVWDLDKEHSFARYLREKGYDVWAVNLRGSGDSSKPALSDLRSISKLQIHKIPRILFRAIRNITKTDWNIDDHIQKDLPAIITFVQAETGYDKVTWVGHSMGAMIMYAYLETEDAGNIKRFVAIGGKLYASKPASKILSVIASQKPIAHASLLINTTLAYQLRNLTLGAIKPPWEKLFYNRDNMDERTIIRMFRTSIDDTAPGVIRQFADVIKRCEFTSIDNSVNYTKDLYKIRLPMLLVGAPEDKLSTPEAMIYAYENISSPAKTLHFFSKANGYSADYGHCDLILGKNAKEEVYPYIYRWLTQH